MSTSQFFNPSTSLPIGIKSDSIALPRMMFGYSMWGVFVVKLKPLGRYKIVEKDSKEKEIINKIKKKLFLHSFIFFYLFSSGLQ